MKEREKITFIIDHLDPLGQGVDKSSDKITFIPKTLPSESGTAVIVNKSKGVQFAQLENLKVKSPDRIHPACEHFDICSGCDYLHTSYENEQNFKIEAFQKTFAKLAVEKKFYHFADNRLEYRNRIQLHYNKKLGKLGFMKEKSKFIVEVPNCKIALAPIQNSLKALYQNSSWIKKTSKQPSDGHLELYYKDGEIRETFNSFYSDGGFTQVNQEMNDKLKSNVNKLIETHFDRAIPIFDLFSGDGNLVKDQISSYQITHFDSFPHKIPNFVHLDLFKDNDLSKIMIKPNQSVNFVIDPPRSGFKNISQWTSIFKPENIIYVSCNSSTLNRDLHSIQDDYLIKEIHLFDLFPATKHFECMAFCQKR